MELLTFNKDDGFTEAVVRGYRSGILDAASYSNLGQCDSLEDMRMHLQVTDYGTFLQNEPSPLQTMTISEKCTEKLVDEFNYVRCNASSELAKFMDYITYGYMIDNVVLLLTGTLHERDTSELLEKCHPLGKFQSLATLAITTNAKDAYRLVLVDTPLAPYAQMHFNDAHDFTELNIEVIRNTLYKAYLEDFYSYCQSLGGSTAEVMGEILRFEADRRAINITINSLDTELTKEGRAELYCNFGDLYPEGIARLERAENHDAVRAAVEPYPQYRQLFQEATYSQEKSLEDCFFEYEVKLNKLSFEQQFQYGVFYSYLKLKEQEVRNIVWIAECISQDQKARISQYIPIW
ncbi:hypothetical protein GUITHDRAFT_96472 [Guillardia theta CCMP2712]|uniref:V-type proton ATPase subunit n=1 Tax=Guillardia theta (strain CCMP2712) TaxID=905079 RepID=L1IUJ7_GUITC|nr:hypothetical protein GUITHDRAFT_96472 [Guillardia theta CCMP2712]EKX39898.1 hypothetical protein GUITHDRAFT_96472 [Guillardia theta CCMP2712]|mmetsp:Transcript_9814/g.32847  ORF Transcript_9814/g.32847 Transcript_9814/m.32847 type:complete len:349 (-) Transcript_9814:76-1122(-)|eukprot:XP_005826878.1 hypothetical protein GUITHDRAFT_96472 [Guillardia theta CCMP2712]